MSKTQTGQRRWYAVQTYSGHEAKVKTLLERRIEEEGLRDQISQVLIPQREVVEIKNGKKVRVTKNLYPGYILVEMELTQETLHLVNSIQGVIRFLGSETQPQPLRQHEINKILGKIGEVEEKREVEEIPFEVGESVEVTDGPFTDFTGTVDEVYPEKGKVKVIVSLFGRATPIELDYLQLKEM